MKNLLSILLVLLSLGIFGARISQKVAFEQNVKGYLQRAGNANTIELANIELTKALDYLEANNLTSGYTSILWQTPDEDIDFWYRNLKASQGELQTLNSDSALEKTNVLMKLRETLLNGTGRARVPDGLDVYPNNTLWALLMVIAIVAFFIAIIIPAVEAEKKAKQAASARENS